MFVHQNRLRPGLAIAAAIAALAFGGAASAAGTNAGASVSNSFTLDYNVSSVAQARISGGPATFTVDRKVDVTVATVQNATVSPGQNGAQLVYGVTNTGNDNIAYRLTIADVASDSFDVGTYTARYYVDAGNDGIFTPGTDNAGAGAAYTLGSGVTANVAPNATIWVILSANIPGSVTNGQTDGVSLIADSYYPTASLDPAYASTPGANITTAASNTMTGAADSVLADAAGIADAALDGAHSSSATYTVSAASLTASKTVAVVTANPVNCATDAVVGGFATPGACVQYVISAANSSSASAAATNIAISDVLPNEVQYVSAAQSGFTAAGTLATPAVGCTTSCTVGLTGASLAPGATGAVTIRARVR